MYRASAARLSLVSGCQAWPIATSTIARYLALSKKGSRDLAGFAAAAGGLSGPGGRSCDVGEGRGAVMPSAGSWTGGSG